MCHLFFLKDGTQPYKSHRPIRNIPLKSETKNWLFSCCPESRVCFPVSYVVPLGSCAGTSGCPGPHVKWVFSQKCLLLDASALELRWGGGGEKEREGVFPPYPTPLRLGGILPVLLLHTRLSQRGLKQNLNMTINMQWP